MKKLAILGASGHGKVIADCAEVLGWDSISFFDDSWPTIKKNAHWNVIGNTISLIEKASEFDGIFVAIGNNEIREQKVKLLKKNTVSDFPTLIHPSAQISRYATIGHASIILAGAVINAYTTIGDGVIINTSASIDHDCTIGSFVHVSPGSRVAGSVKVGDLSWLGIGSSVIQNVNIEENCIIGAGAVVVKNVPKNITAIGIPARPKLKKSN